MTVTEVGELFFYSCANLLPQLILITITCRDFLRFSLRKTVVLSCAVLLWYFGCLIAHETGLLSYIVCNYVLNIGYVLFGILLTKGKPWQLLFALGMVLNYGSVCAITSGCILHVLGLWNLLFGWQESLLTLCIAAVFGLLYDWLLVKKLRPLFLREDTADTWRVLWLVPALFCVIHYFCIWTCGGSFAVSVLNVIFLVVVNLGSAFVSYLIANTVDERAQRLQLEAENQRLAIQAVQCEHLNERMEETRRVRHDLRQHLRLMQSYLDSDNQAALRTYLSEYAQALSADTDVRYCENTVADMTVRYYAQLARAQGIDFRAKANLPEDLPLPGPELCVLLGNLLENALDSCKKHPGEASYIYLRGNLVGKRLLTIVVDNSPADEPARQKDSLLSSKRPSAGTGTASAQAIARRYGGDARFDWKDRVFSASVVLTLPAETA